MSFTSWPRLALSYPRSSLMRKITVSFHKFLLFTYYLLGTRQGVNKSDLISASQCSLMVEGEKQKKHCDESWDKSMISLRHRVVWAVRMGLE